MFQDIALGRDFRLIAISDIHGNKKALEKVLQKAAYQPGEDVLILCGDLIEKGPESLATLRCLMDLAERGRVHALLGNCDTILLDVLSTEALPGMDAYLLRQPHSIIHEMCREAGIACDPKGDLPALFAALREIYAPEIAFVKGLPLAIETENLLFAHGGLEPKPDYRRSAPEKILRQDRFYEVDYVFPKPVIVGHWPVLLYGDDRMDASPIIDRDKNIIAIDGGNSIKEAGQLNALIIQGQDGEITFDHVAVDDLPTARVAYPQEGSRGRKVSWPYDKLVITDETQTHVTGVLTAYDGRGRVPEGLDTPITLPRELTFTRYGHTYVEQCMLESLPLFPGDVVSLVGDGGGETCVCKHRGRVGLVSREKLAL